MMPDIERTEESAVSSDPPSSVPEGIKETALESKSQKVKIQKGEVMTELEKVIKMHEQEQATGYTCKNKDNKYARDFDAHYDDWKWYNTRKNPGDYCTIYFDWIFVQALGLERARKVLNRPLYSCGAGVRWSRSYLKDLGRVGNEPKVGCAVYFGELPYPHHIGFVYKVTDKMIYTYEGNCYVSNGVTGIKAKQYSRDYKDILDYGYPVYDEAPDPGPKELDGYKVGNTYEVMYDNLQIRKGPSTSYDSVGSFQTGDTLICAALASDGSGNTWIQHKTGWSCAHQGDKRYIDEPKKIGWIKENGKWYFYDNDGNMMKSAWEKYKGEWYYLGGDGAMVTGWQTIGGEKYYFYPDGHMAVSEWVDGLYLDHDGCQRYKNKGKWKKNNKGWWFEDESGCYPKGRSVMINRIEYEFDKDGYLIEK